MKILPGMILRYRLGVDYFIVLSSIEHERSWCLDILRSDGKLIDKYEINKKHYRDVWTVVA